MNNNLRIIKKNANAEILARIMKAACRKYDCSMEIDFAGGNRTVKFIGAEEYKARVAGDVETMLNGGLEGPALS